MHLRSATLVLSVCFFVPQAVVSSDVGTDIPTIQRAIDDAGANWTAGDNEIWRMPADEFALLTCEPEGMEAAVTGMPRQVTAVISTPPSYSCATWMTPVKNMGYTCSGSVCAFAIAGAYEARYNRLLENGGWSLLEIDLSEQAFLSCYHMSCGGCWPTSFLDYFLASGIPDEACFPYVSSQTVPGPCAPCADVDSRLFHVYDVGSDNPVTEDEMRQEIYDHGPIVSYLYVYDDFSSYISGVYQHVSGSASGGTTIVIYGWGVDVATPYWLCKNQWGANWGEIGPDGNRGWFRILRGSNECQCEEYMFFMTPVLQDSDSDGVPDSEDVCPGYSDYDDYDSDGFPDECDNCPLVSNVDQADTDGNDIGDACEACCVGRVGDANNSLDDEPTIGDIGALISALFIAGTCDGVIQCMTEADLNQSGGLNPVCEDITISDIGVLISYLFINGPYDPATNPTGTQLSDCL